jgi:hypothetical protein
MEAYYQGGLAKLHIVDAVSDSSMCLLERLVIAECFLYP